MQSKKDAKAGNDANGLTDPRLMGHRGLTRNRDHGPSHMKGCTGCLRM
ncbi:hypothetical protein Hdeb2414_s0011g00374311 [Helianthus debilis subsp. tardiflorus]